MSEMERAILEARLAGAEEEARVLREKLGMGLGARPANETPPASEIRKTRRVPSRRGGAKAPPARTLKAMGVDSIEMAAAAADLRRSGCK